MPPSESFYTLNRDCTKIVVAELRKYFGVRAPYDQLVPPGLIPPALVFQETAEHQPVKGQLWVSSKWPKDDRMVPCIVITGMTPTPHPLGFSQRGQKPIQTQEPNRAMPDGWKAPNVRCASTADVPLATLLPGLVMDDITLVAGDRVLLKDQAAGQENGAWMVPVSGMPTRATDFNTAVQFVQATTFPVSLGTANGGLFFSQITPQPIVLGTTPIVYENIDGDTLEWDETAEAVDVVMNISLRADSTPQRDDLCDLLTTGLNDLSLVRGQLALQDVYIQPPGLRGSGYSEEAALSGTMDEVFYRADFSMTLYQQWNRRFLRLKPNVHQWSVVGSN